MLTQRGKGTGVFQLKELLVVGISIWNLKTGEMNLSKCRVGVLCVPVLCDYVAPWCRRFCFTLGAVSPSRSLRFYTQLLYHCGLTKIIHCTTSSTQEKLMMCLPIKWKEHFQKLQINTNLLGIFVFINRLVLGTTLSVGYYRKWYYMIANNHFLLMIHWLSIVHSYFVTSAWNYKLLKWLLDAIVFHLLSICCYREPSSKYT